MGWVMGKCFTLTQGKYVAFCCLVFCFIYQIGAQPSESAQEAVRMYLTFLGKVELSSSLPAVGV